MSTQRTHLARQLRNIMTDAERKLWRHLRQQQTGIKFRRQFPLGPYILDFVSLDARLNIEIDGGQHADNTGDVIRDRFVQSQRFKVLRFWNNEVLANIEGVMEIILQHLPPPNLPRQAGEEQSVNPAEEIPSPLAGEG
jgi:BirA family biotin operon repressor/biotin-[acetyl-CoA-carboxylase] ligase